MDSTGDERLTDTEFRLDSASPGDFDRDVDDASDSIDSLLDFLPDDAPAFSAQAIASQVFRSEERRFLRRSAAFKSVAFLFSFCTVIVAWRLGSGIVNSPGSATSPTPGIEQFQGLFRLVPDEAFNEALFATKSATIWDKAGSDDPRDIAKLAAAYGSLPRSAAEAIEKRAIAGYLALTAPDREKWKNLSIRLSKLPDPDRSIVQNRLQGLRLVLGSMPEGERRRAEALTGRDRWDFLVQRAENQKRLAAQAKRPGFSVSEFNRPDYLMDLARVTRAWNDLTPAQKKNVERRAMTSKADPARKIDRLRILALSLEADGVGSPHTKPALARGGPLQRALAKAETFKQEREKRRSDYLKIVSGTIPTVAAPAELERILDSAPSWLVESIDPLPPDEARRFLSLLKFLVENQDVEGDDEGVQGR